MNTANSITVTRHTSTATIKASAMDPALVRRMNEAGIPKVAADALLRMSFRGTTTDDKGHLVKATRTDEELVNSAVEGWLMCMDVGTIIKTVLQKLFGLDRRAAKAKLREWE